MMIATTVYVVTCTLGEYEVRDSWVAGVFANREQAICVADEMVSLSKAAILERDIWIQKRDELAGGPVWQMGPLTTEARKRITDQIGQPPSGGDADDYYITEVHLNCWGHWNPLEGVSA